MLLISYPLFATGYAWPSCHADGEPGPVFVWRDHQPFVRGAPDPILRPRPGRPQHPERPRPRPQAIQRVQGGVQPQKGLQLRRPYVRNQQGRRQTSATGEKNYYLHPTNLAHLGLEQAYFSDTFLKGYCATTLRLNRHFL